MASLADYTHYATVLTPQSSFHFSFLTVCVPVPLKLSSELTALS